MTSGKAELLDDMELFGLHEEAQAYRNRPEPCYEIWPENHTTWEVFNAQGSQWEVITGMTCVVTKGINYSRVKDTMELMGVDRAEWPEVFAGLRIMEQAALKVFREKEAA